MHFLAVLVSFITCHGGPADHFASFAECLIEEGYEVELYASGPAFKTFEARNITATYFDAESSSNATQIAKRCSKSAVVITDAGHPFDIPLQEALSKEAPETLRIAYYDNPEPFVPGGYSKTASNVMALAQKTLFANANLAKETLYEDLTTEIDLPFEKRIGLGYYPISRAEKIAEKRTPKKNLLVYFGGNNEEYFEKAFPSFLRTVSEACKIVNLSKFEIVLQQHPGAKAKNIDGMQLEEWIKKHADNSKAPRVSLSEKSSEEILLLAETALYYQTSMGPLFALAGISTIQVGHKTYEDLLIKSGLCRSATNSFDFIDALEERKSPSDAAILFEKLGINKEWFKALKDALQ